MKTKFIAVAALGLFAGSAAAQPSLSTITAPLTEGADVFAGILSNTTGALIGDVGNGPAAPGAPIAHGQASGILGGSAYLADTLSGLTGVLTTTIKKGARIPVNAAQSRNPAQAIAQGSKLFANTVEGLLDVVSTAATQGGDMLGNNVNNASRAITHGITNGSAILVNAIESGAGGFSASSLGGGLPGLDSLPVGPEALLGLIETLRGFAPGSGSGGSMLPSFGSLPFGPQTLLGLIETLTSLAPSSGSFPGVSTLTGALPSS